MEKPRFDHLTKWFAIAGTRRGVLELVTALPLAGALSLHDDRSGAFSRQRHKPRHSDRRDRAHDEKKKKKKKKKRPCAQSGQTPGRGQSCCAGLVPNGAGQCAQPPSPTCASSCSGCCNGETCVTATSNAACGGGGVACGTCSNPTPACVNGSCAACTSSTQCSAGAVCEGGACLACDVCAVGCPFPTVRDALNAATAGATIRICPGTYQEDITISKKVTIAGAGQGTGAGDTVLQGTGANSVVTILGFNPPATLKRLRITGGAGAGGGINITGTDSVLTIEDCTITVNTGRSPGGGGIHNSAGSRVVLRRCTVSNNTTVDPGGGIHNLGQMTLIDCTVSGNNAVTYGGGILNGGAGTIRLESSSVRQNTAPAGGGIKTSGSIVLESSDVTGNAATYSGAGGNGGGIDNAGQLTVTDSTVSSNTAGYQGAGIYNSGTTIVDNSRVTNNHATVDGGGIFSGAGTATLRNDASVSGNTPTNCVGVTGAGCATP